MDEAAQQDQYRQSIFGFTAQNQRGGTRTDLLGDGTA